jgi:membrane-associated phospholipid phosphatase
VPARDALPNTGAVTSAISPPPRNQVATAPVVEAAQAADEATDAAARKAAEETLPTGTALARGRGATAIAIAGLAGFAGIFALVRARRSEAVDLALMLRLQRRRSAVLERLMAAASWLGFPPQSRLVPPAVIAALWLLKFRVEAAFQLLGWGTGAVSTVVKALMKRPRPVAGTDLRVVTAPLGGTSFPSGHVITYVGTYGFLAYLAHTLVRPRTWRRAIAGGLLAMLALVGPSRIYQGHHWPTDVTASYMLGTSYLIGLIALYRRAKERLGRGEDVARRTGT